MKHHTTLDASDPDLLWQAMLAETYSTDERELAEHLYTEHALASGEYPIWEEVPGIKRVRWCELACFVFKNFTRNPGPYQST